MKKFSFLVALLAVMAFATSAFAAQILTTQADGTVMYKPTPKVLNADGNTNYPYEIYLPNEATPANYRIHSNYTKNTDACAACHATHTAVGNSLLQWYTVYDTCMACHDGTIATTYNVQEGEIGTGKPTFGGMFGTGTEGSLSNHNVTGAMEIAAAPGGSVVAETSNVEGDATKAKTRWASEFGCESCHTPHGQGGNARILHPDANWAATASRGNGEYFMDVAGYVYKDAGFTKPAYLLKGYPYSPAVYAGASKISGVTFDNSTGVTKVVYGNLGIITKVYGTAALQVKMQISNYLNGATEDVKHVSGMNGFCGACHTDYNTEGFVNPETLKVNAGSAEFETGTYSKAHRHQVGFTYSSPTKASVVNAKLKFEGTATMECLTCHVAHGTSLDYWKRTVGDVADGGNGYIATADLVEFAGSSALKRIPNMGTCEACHAKGDGNEGYGANSMAEANYAGKTATKGVANASFAISALGAKVTANWVGSKACENCHADYYAEYQTAEHGIASHSLTYNTATNSGCGGGAIKENLDGATGAITQVNRFGCHQNGKNVMNATTGSFASAVAGGDGGVTCESCHGSAAKHVNAPNKYNISSPKTFDEKVYTCARCHEVYTFGTGKDMALASNTYGQTVTKFTYPGINNAGQSVASSTYTTKALSSSHFGVWKFADSKHFQQGLVACSDCHNPHALEIENYNALCMTCHDSGTFAGSDAVLGVKKYHGTIAMNDHSFSFGFKGETIANGAVPTLTYSATNKIGTTVLTAKKVIKPSAFKVETAAGAGTYYSTNTGGFTVTFNGSSVLPVGVTFDKDNGAIIFARGTNPNDAAGNYVVSYTCKANSSVTVAPITVTVQAIN